jgi:hypothetical protein
MNKEHLNVLGRIAYALILLVMLYGVLFHVPAITSNALWFVGAIVAVKCLTWKVKKEKRPEQPNPPTPEPFHGQMIGDDDGSAKGVLFDDGAYWDFTAEEGKLFTEANKLQLAGKENEAEAVCLKAKRMFGARLTAMAREDGV